MHLAVRVHVVLRSLFGMLCRVDVVTMRQLGMVAGAFVQALFVVAGGFAMMTRSVLVMLRCLPVVVRCFM